MIIYVIRVIQDPMGFNPQIKYFVTDNLAPYKTQKNNFIYEIVDMIQCDLDEYGDELLYINHDIRSGVYDNTEGSRGL